MCKYCAMNENDVAKKPIQILSNGEHTFIEKADGVYQMTSYRKKLDSAYASFTIYYCPICGRNLKDSEKIFKCQTFLEPYN